jgi:hypothetical protein
MIPRILEFEDGRVKVTAEAYTIPEVHALIKKYEEDVEPYLAYVSAFSYPDGIYIRIPKEDRKEAALYDIKSTLGEFDEEDDLIQPAIDRLRSLWESVQTKSADELEEELSRWMVYLKNTPLGGEEMKNRLAIVDKYEKAAQTAVNLRKLADEEIGVKMKGSNVMGEY